MDVDERSRTVYRFVPCTASVEFSSGNALPATWPATRPGTLPGSPQRSRARLAALTTAASEASRMLESMPTPHHVVPSSPSAST